MTITVFQRANLCLRRLALLTKTNVNVTHNVNGDTHVISAWWSEQRSLVIRRHSSSQFVQGVRYLQRLKEDDQFCRDSWANGKFAVLYDMRPVLAPSGDGKRWGIVWNDANELQETLQDDFHKTVHDSIVLNCSSSGPTSPPKFAVNIPAKPETDHRMKVEQTLRGSAVNGRKAFLIVSRADAMILSQCLALLQWHSRSQFCSNCGGRTNKDPSGSKRMCLHCDIIHYPALSPVAIVLVTQGDSCLVARQKQFPQGMYSAIAGFCEPGESLDTAVRREIAEEVGLEVAEVEFFSSQPWAFPTSTLMLACHACVKPGTTTEVCLDAAELEDSRWLHRDEVRAILGGKVSSRGTDLWLPPSAAIAHHLLKSWASQEQ